MVVLGGALANPAARETRHAVPVGVTMDGMIVMEDDLDSRNEGMDSRMVNPTMLTARKVGATSMVPADQQGEEQRYPYGGGGYGGYGWGRPWGPYGRPWGPYGRPWGPYIPYRPWGPF